MCILYSVSRPRNIQDELYVVEGIFMMKVINNQSAVLFCSWDHRASIRIRFGFDYVRTSYHRRDWLFRLYMYLFLLCSNTDSAVGIVS
jgi:hypothetical protein